MKNSYNYFSNNVLKLLISAIILFSAFNVSGQPMTGSFTINSAVATGGNNFQSFTAFAAALMTNGVSGNVTATVTPGSGPYNEQVVFSSISGLGPSAVVTLEGSGETITAVTTTTDRHVIRLSSLQYFVINNLTVNYDAGSTGGFYGIHIFNSGNNITISNCTINIQGTTSTLFGSIVASGDETSILAGGDYQDITIEGNTTTGGGYGVSLYGLPSNLATGISITNNNIYDFHSNGVYLRETNGAVVSNNNLDKTTSNIVSANAIQIAQSANVNAEIFNNTISISQTSNGTSILRGIYLFGGTGHKVYNNVIHDIKLTSGDFSGIEIRAAGSAPEIYYNTISIDHTSSTNGILIGIGEELSNTNSMLRNNMISISQQTSTEKAALALGAVSTISTAFNSNNNVFNIPGGNIALKSGTTPVSYSTLASWTGASGNDANSVAADPLFVSASTSIPTSVAVNNTGTPIAGITTDITGATRGTPPDAGAYEFTPSSVEESVLSNPHVFPVPASDELYITGKFSGNHINIEIYDLAGKLMIAEGADIRNDMLTLNIKPLNSGFYLLRVSDKSFPFTVVK